MSREAAMAAALGSTVPIIETPVLKEGVVDNLSDAEAKTVHPGSEMPSKAFSHLAKKEAELVRQRQELNAEKERVTSISKKAEEFEALRKTDPVAALKMLGFSETEIFNYMAQQAPVELTPEQKAIQAAETATDARIKAFEESQAKKEADIQKKADDAVVASYKSNVAKAIAADPEKFEYCAYHGTHAEDLIYKTVLAIVEESEGKDVPTPEEAAQMVETYYEERDLEMSKLKKRQPKVEAPLPSTEKAQPSRRTPDPVKPTRTIPGSATATSASAKTIVNETASQKRERLIEKLRGG